MATLGALIKQLLGVELILFNYSVTVGNIFFFTWLSVLIIGFIRRLFD